MKAKLLIWLCKNWKKNKGKDYPQTGGYIVHFKQLWLEVFLQWLCNLCGGHELSKTEWSYGGEKYADRWCRWCGKLIRVPKESIYFQFKESDPKPLMNKVEKSL